MSRVSMLAGDLVHKDRESSQLPSVEDWVRAGGRVQRVGEPPRVAQCQNVTHSVWRRGVVKKGNNRTTKGNDHD